MLRDAFSKMVAVSYGLCVLLLVAPHERMAARLASQQWMQRRYGVDIQQTRAGSMIPSMKGDNFGSSIIDLLTYDSEVSMGYLPLLPSSNSPFATSLRSSSVQALVDRM